MQDETTRTTRAFQTAPPLPMKPVSWDTGWSSATKSGMSTMASRLSNLRTAAIGGLFESEHASSTRLEETASKLEAYGKALSALCQSHAPDRRRVLLVFVWCFPAEYSATNKTVVMRSSLVAFEYLCVMCACAIVWDRAAVSYHVDENEDKTNLCFHQNFRVLETLLCSLPDAESTSDRCVMNRAQWSRLQRQALPLQLHTRWLQYFKVAVAQRYQMCCMLRCLQEGKEDMALGTMHGTERITFDIFVRARGILLHTQNLHDKQQSYVNIIYNDALRNLIRFRNQTLISDAEYALSQTMPTITRILVTIVRRSIAKHHSNLDEESTHSMLKRCDELAAIIASTNADEITESQCMQWRHDLPSYIFPLK